MQKYIEIIKSHGFINGTKRAFEQIIENDLYDFFNGVDTSAILDNEYYSKNIGKKQRQ